MAKRRRDQRTARALDAFKSMIHAVNGMARLQWNQLTTFGLTISQFQVLEALLNYGPMSQAELSESMFCGQSNISFLTERLRKRGLVVQLVNENDKRGKLIHLTPEGRRLISKVFLLHATLIRAQMSVLEGREQEALFRLCVKLANSDPVKFLREILLGDEGEVWMRSRIEARAIENSRSEAAAKAAQRESKLRPQMD